MKNGLFSLPAEGAASRELKLLKQLAVQRRDASIQLMKRKLAQRLAPKHGPELLSEALPDAAD